MIVNQLADYITELKLGNGTSVLIFANIASYLPSALGQAFTQASESGSSSIAVYMIAFVLTAFGVVYVQVLICWLNSCGIQPSSCVRTVHCPFALSNACPAS